MFCNMYVANNSSILQYCHGMSIEGVLVFYRTTEYANSWKGGGGGGLTERRKRKSSLLRPPPLFFLKVGRKRGGGGRNSGAVRCENRNLSSRKEPSSSIKQAEPCTTTAAISGGVSGAPTAPLPTELAIEESHKPASLTMTLANGRINSFLST